MKHAKNLVWIDLEMTGLNPEEDVILEIATIITNPQLEQIAPELSFVIHQPKERLDQMNEWCKKQHGASGLTNAVIESKVLLQQAQEETLKYLYEYCFFNTALLCGNSIWNDRIFLKKYMPEIDGFLNYRMIDVTSIKEVIWRWYPESSLKEFKKKDLHRALPDIQESIEELKHYRKNFFVHDAEITKVY